jgi:hypothetical protein
MQRRSSILHFVFPILAVSALSLLTCASLRAQVDTGSITGAIKDQSGAVIPGAKLSLRNEGTDLMVTATTGPDGSYTFSPVKIGSYELSAEAAGFSKAVQAHITVSIDQHIVLDLSLTPGVVTQTVEVTAAPPALQTQDASVGQVVNSRSVNDLPLNGRNFTFLAQTVAGVNTPQPDTRGNAANGAFSANGMRPSQNNYLLDGIDNNSDNVDFLNGTNFVVLPPPDALSEFKVQTTDFSSQYGRAGGAIMNATIKSGTNQLHGDVWEFVRNDKFDAADFFEDEGNVTKGEYRQNQYGLTIGGPVVIPHVFNGRDKLFFFGDYEALRRHQGSVFSNTVPTADEVSSGYTNLADVILGGTDPACLSNGSCTYTDNLGRTLPDGTVTDPATTREVVAGQTDPVTGLTATASGYISDPFYTAGPVGKTMNFASACTSESNCQLNQLPANRIDPNAVKLFGLYPVAQKGFVNGAPTVVLNNTTDPLLEETRNAMDSRMDFNKSDRDQIFGTFSYISDPIFLPGPFGGIADGGAFQQGEQDAKSILGALSYTHIFSPSLVNEVRLGEDRLHATRYGPVGTQLGIPAQFGIQGIGQAAENGGLPAITIGNLSTLGSNPYLPSDEITQTTQLTENLTKIYGKHSFKMGMEFQHIKFSTLQPACSHGCIDFNGTFAGVGMAQMELTPTASSLPAGVGLDNVGGSDDIYISNFSPTDDGHNYWAAYFQDDWKVTPKLTLNLGLRWDHFGQIAENHGRQANFVPNVTPGGQAEYLEPSNGKNQAIVVNSTFPTGLAKDNIALKYIGNFGLATTQDDNFGPRIGVAYRVLPKVVLRTGFGIFYNGFENAGYGPNIGENYPFQFTIGYSNPNGGTPITVPRATGGDCLRGATLEQSFACIPLDPSLIDTEGLGLEGLQYNWKTPYTLGWNFTLEYEITPSMTLNIGYVGNATRHLDEDPGANSEPEIEMNPLAPTSLAGSAEPFPDFGGGGSYQMSAGSSYYSGLQTSLEKRYSNGLNFLATYTWAHCRSDAGDLLNGGAVYNRAAWVQGIGIQHDYGDCDFNIFDVFHYSGGYQLPFGAGSKFLSHANGITNQIVGGWSFIWNATLEGGQPISIGCPYGTNNSIGCQALTVPGQSQFTNNGHPVDGFWNPNGFTQPCPAPGFSQPSRCTPVTTLPSIAVSGTNIAPCTPVTACVGLLGGTIGQTSGPAIGRLDFSTFKNFRLNERSHLEFRAEFFNITNHPTFNAPGFGGNGVVSVSGSTNFFNTNFGKIGSTRFPFLDPRQIQFALKLYF